MEILAHRGVWDSNDEKNSKIAIQSAFAHSWGIETDIRDYLENLVISHDVSTHNNFTFAQLLDFRKLGGRKGTLGLNIKADGLSDILLEELKAEGISDYFVFDMSIPETLRYLKLGMNVFLRSSEYEVLNDTLLLQVQGIWLDGFTKIWYDREFVDSHLGMGKKIAFVSCELHNRNQIGLWELIKKNNWHFNNNVMLCTDLPSEAVKFFEKI